MVCVTISQAWLFCLAGISPLPVQEAHGHEHSKRNKRNQWDKLQGEIKRGEKQIQPGGPKAFSAKRDTTRLFQLLLHKHISIFLLGTICKHWWYRKVGGGDLNQSFPVVAEQASTAVGQNFGPFPVTKLFVLCKILCKSGLIGRLEMGKLSVDSVQLLIYVCALDHHPVAFGHAVLADVLLQNVWRHWRIHFSVNDRNPSRPRFPKAAPGHDAPSNIRHSWDVFVSGGVFPPIVRQSQTNGCSNLVSSVSFKCAAMDSSDQLRGVPHSFQLVRDLSKAMLATL